MTKSEFLSILFLHRDRLKADSDKPGWNKWALFGALASLVWLGLDLYSSGKFVREDALLVLFCVVTIEGIITGLGIFGDEKSQKIDKKYRSINDDIQAGLSSLVYTVATYTFFIQFFNEFDSNNSIFPLIYCWFMLVTFSLIILARRFILHVPDNLNSNKIVHNGAKVVFYVHLIVSAIVVYCTILLISDFFSVVTIRSALITIGVYYVLEKLITEFQRNPLIDSIDELIDDVTFNDLTTEDANSKLKMILIGSEFNEIIADKMKDYLSLHRSINMSQLQFNARVSEYYECTDSTKAGKKEQLKLDYNGLKKVLKKLEELEISIKKTLLNFLPFEYQSQDYDDLMINIQSGKTIRIAKDLEIEKKYSGLK